MLGVQTVLNALTALAAVEYNQKRFYSKKAIKLIQRHIGAPETGVWDFQSCTAVYDWQRSVLRLRPIKGDGMFGPTSLGILIEELVILGHPQDAEFLRQFKHKDKFGNIITKEVKDSDKPVIAFFRYPASALDLRRHPTNPANWIMKGSFKVEVYLDHSIPEPSRYEYRQFIRGYVYVHDGYFGDAKNNTHWQPRAGTKQEEVNNAMAIPGGLNRHFFTEDGEVIRGTNKIERFGYRSNPYKWEEGIMDFYSNDQMGPEYRLQDTFGIEGPRKVDIQGQFRSGLKVGVHLEFRGIVIKDGKMPTHLEMNSGDWRKHCVAHKEWEYKEERFVTW